ncbi:hypothetical protein K1T71_004923 [Dendrolimus kikuchii]|uniref:Uncharacterized protein n=1 Tax=Dendrolimus kikuchii TaxID=765133 RepID=A0ACC1D5W9_9NEOP|nr:hypothetical protein K1T71_004923 [Dendrolimus kikuchii]
MKVPILTAMFWFIVSAVDIGYPVGFMSDCPGMNKSTTVSRKTKESIGLVLIYPSDNFFGQNEAKCYIGKDGTACVAKYLDFRNRKTQVLINGYLDHSYAYIPRSLISSYLARDRNIIVMEAFFVLLKSYPIAARLSKPLGIILGELLADLRHYGLSANTLELIGGSLGAHMAYYASMRYQELTGQRISRLTALDPAGPCFRNLPRVERLNSDAADRVDVLHTNIDGFGIAAPSGHVDFYANGGEYQPSMTGSFILPCFLLCSHVRSALYWVEALKYPEAFIGVRCDTVSKVRVGDCYNRTITTNVLGVNTDFNKPGIYYLPTRAKAPYHVGVKALKKAKYGVNTYLLKPSPDKDMTF